jgi:uncharacterized linocin/CFP29 family protein
MDDLKRELAPISTAAWSEINDMARKVLELNLAARKLVDFNGPLGWTHAAIPTGRLEPMPAAPVAEVEAALRATQPLVETRARFHLKRAELDAVDRGSNDPDLDPLVVAAIRIGHAEDRAVFHGYAQGRIKGLCGSTPHPALTIPEKYDGYPGIVAEATRLLRTAGVDGPYGIALGPRCYTGLTQATGHGGYPILDVVRQLVGGPVVWAPALDGAVVLSVRGGDHELTIGRDVAIGYLSHTDVEVELYLTETFMFRVRTPEAAVCLVYAD